MTMTEQVSERMGELNLVVTVSWRSRSMWRIFSTPRDGCTETGSRHGNGVRVSSGIIQAGDGHVLVVTAVMYAPAAVRTVAQLCLGTNAINVVKPDLSTSCAVCVAE